MSNYLASFADYYNAISPWFWFSVGILKIIFILVSLALFIGTIILLFKASWLKKRYFEDAEEMSSYKSGGEKKMFKDWKKITNRLDSQIEPEYKLAILEADDLVDGVFAKMGYSGSAMAEKINKMDISILPNMSAILEAHKIRDNIVHDPDYKLDLARAKETIGVYEQALRDLEFF
jgi:hypothetical protein